MQCKYTVTYDDFLQSMRLYRSIWGRVAIVYYVYVWIVPILGITLFFAGLVMLVRGYANVGGPFFWSACVGLGVGCGLPARYRDGLRRAYKHRNVLTQDRPMLCEFDQTRIRFIVPGGAEISYGWDAFSHYRENEQVAVVFIQQAAFHTIPKRAMEEPGWIEFRSYLRPETRNA